MISATSGPSLPDISRRSKCIGMHCHRDVVWPQFEISSSTPDSVISRSAKGSMKTPPTLRRSPFAPIYILLLLLLLLHCHNITAACRRVRISRREYIHNTTTAGNSRRSPSNLRRLSAARAAPLYLCQSVRPSAITVTR